MIRMYSRGEISEAWYDENLCPVDRDNNGESYYLNYQSNYMYRSKVLYHQKILQDKRYMTQYLKDKFESNKIIKVLKAEIIIRHNELCEFCLLKQMKVPEDSEIDTSTFTSSTLDQF